MAMSDFLEDTVLEMVLNSVVYAEPASVYVSLHTGSPLDDDSGANEVTTVGTAYARQIRTAGFTVAGTTPTRGGNTASIDYTTATLDWGVISHVGIYDAVTGGNLLFHGALTANRTVDSGDTFSFAADALGVAIA